MDEYRSQGSDTGDLEEEIKIEYTDDIIYSKDTLGKAN